MFHVPEKTEEEQFFSSDELAIFKRYLEENTYYPENQFEYLENNMSYYSGRYTSADYFSPAEFFHANANLYYSDELKENWKYYEKAVEWYYTTVHPENSPNVLKGEKYLFLDQVPCLLQKLIRWLNKGESKNFFTVDLIIYHDGKFFQYLPRRNFVIQWKKEAHKRHRELIKNRCYLIEEDEITLNSLSDYDYLLFPIFVPIRKMIFLGEFGYRSSLIEYGKCIETILSFLKQEKIKFLEFSRFFHRSIHHYMGIDGIEKSILSIIFMKGA